MTRTTATNGADPTAAPNTNGASTSHAPGNASRRSAALALGRNKKLEVFRLVDGFKDRFKDTDWNSGGATADLMTIYDRFTAGTFNIGVWTTKLVVVDIDAHHDGEQAWMAKLSEWGIPEPETYIVLTPSGGRHLYFDAEGQLYGQSDLAPGINIRSSGGYVLGAGSMWNGKTYVAANDRPILPIPEPLKIALRKRVAEWTGDKIVCGELFDDDIAKEAAINHAKAATAAIEGRSGDGKYVAVARRCFDFGISEQTCFEIMTEHYNPRCTPVPSDEAWVRLKIENAWKYPTGHPIGAMHPKLGFDELEPKLQAYMRATGQAPEAKPAVVIKATPYVRKDPTSLEPRDFIYGHHLVRKFMSATVAPGGVGKSQLIIAERLAIITGRPLLGVHVPKRGKVWYWNGEDPYDELERRIEATCKYYGVTPQETEGRLFVDSGRDMPLVIAREERSGLVIAHPVIEAVKAAIKANGIDVFTVDPFVSSHEISENDNSKINSVARQWAMVADACDCAVELVHHVRKTGGAEITVEDARGGSALHDATRSMRALNRMTAEEAEKAGVENHRLYFRTDDANNKTSLKAPAVGATWFKLESVGLGNHRLDRDEDKIGVATRWQWPDAFVGLPDNALELIIRALADGKWRDHVAAKEWVGQGIGKALGLDAQDKRGKQRLREIIGKYTTMGVLEVYEDLDEHRKVKDFVRLRSRPRPSAAP